MMKRLLWTMLLCAALMACALPTLAEPRPLQSMDELPETNEEGFLPAGEQAVYYRDHAEGHWYYLSDTLRLEITRTQTKKPLLTYYVADIVCASGTSLYTVNWNDDKPGRTNGLPQDIAVKAGAVYAQSGDFYSYRIKQKKYPGVIIRDGKILYSQTAGKAWDRVPNLATMAFFSSGKAEVNEAWEVSAKEFAARGASTVVSFGPILVRGGEMADLDKKECNHKEPRSCMGIIEPGHYVGLLVEGRKNHSDGCDLTTCAQILYDLGCTDALNLDGGNTAAMLFLGESVQLANNGGVDVNDRAVPDMLCVGRID